MEEALLKLVVDAALQHAIAERIPGKAQRERFFDRLAIHGPRLNALLTRIYGGHEAFSAFWNNLLLGMAEAAQMRPSWLHRHDAERERNPNWYQGANQLGAVCYVDLYAENLAGLKAQLPYFKQLGITYLHLMPLFKVPEPESDGGYAVSSYREVNPKLGNMREFAALAQAFSKVGIALCLDFIFNHTSDEHAWALAAKHGDLTHQAFFHIFPDRRQPDAYEQTLREIFPDEHPGAFTQHVIGKEPVWIWTTFHRYQWDLNYANPRVFHAMAQEMLFLANQGVEVLRMDAVAFIWKQLGTSCENLPEAHVLIQAFNAVCRIAAPALLFKSEAIVHPDDVVKYVSVEECQLSYNPLLMALLWNSVATRKVRLLRKALAERHLLPAGTAWVNYVRVHDDIGWTFSDEDALQLGIHGADHRRFLNQFFTNRFPGSFARGVPFQENPKTGDCRISGTCASLAGLEAADSESLRELALCRILLLHAITLSVGGMPLLYLGDEQGQLNDYAYIADPARQHDSRWVHRPTHPDSRPQQALTPGLQAKFELMYKLRASIPAFGTQALHVLNAHNDHVLVFAKVSGQSRVIVLANFSERPQLVSNAVFVDQQHVMIDVLTRERFFMGAGVAIAPLRVMWLCRANDTDQVSSQQGTDIANRS